MKRKKLILICIMALLQLSSCDKIASLFKKKSQDTEPKKQERVVTPSRPRTRVDTYGKPQLCIIIDDFGSFDNALLDDFCKIDPAVTFAIIPGLNYSRSSMQKAIKSGREVIVHIPMEAENSDVNPGNNAIRSNMSSVAIYNRVKEYFTELDQAIGANNHMGSKITANKELMRYSLRYLSEKNLLFVDSRTTANTVAREIATEMRVPFAERNIFLDAPDNTDAVLRERIKDLEKYKGNNGRVLVITHCFDNGRLQRLKTFIEEAKKMGFVLVPVSEYVKQEPIS